MLSGTPPCSHSRPADPHCGLVCISSVTVTRLHPARGAPAALRLDWLQDPKSWWFSFLLANFLLLMLKWLSSYLLVYLKELSTNPGQQETWKTMGEASPASRLFSLKLGPRAGWGGRVEMPMFWYFWSAETSASECFSLYRHVRDQGGHWEGEMSHFESILTVQIKISESDRHWLGRK